MAAALCAASASPALAQLPGAATALPPEVDAALARARLPRESLSVLVTEAQGNVRTQPRLAHRAQVPVNPASVMKLVTTYSALDTLGPDFTWKTKVTLDGSAPIQLTDAPGNDANLSWVSR